jgi:hypothetical protein
MKTKQLTIILFTFLCSTAIGQTRDCGTMEALQIQQQQDSTLKERMDSLEIAKQNYLKESGKYEDHSKLNLPIIPGFTPTGDHETDLKNFAIAKQELYANDPELYKKLTRSESNSKNKRK